MRRPWWLRLAEHRGSNPLYRLLRDSVRTAAAQARLAAEVETFKNRPESWLRYGPGKETTVRRGWSQAVRSSERADGPPNLLAAPEVQRVFHELIEIVTPHPELRLQIADLLDGQTQRSERRGGGEAGERTRL
jgi:hypothetical protein